MQILLDIIEDIDSLVVYENNAEWVLIKPICSKLGIDAARQIKKLNKDPRFIVKKLLVFAPNSRKREYTPHHSLIKYISKLKNTN